MESRNIHATVEYIIGKVKWGDIEDLSPFFCISY